MIAILTILFFRFVFYKNTEIATIYPDSNGYINFSLRDFFTTGYTNGRTPIYPIIISFFRLFSKDNFLIGVVLFQIAVSLVSVLFLYKILVRLTSYQSLSLIITTIYGASPTLMSFDVCILTESLAISGSVFFLYGITSYIKTPSLKAGISSIIFSFILTMHKPTFVLFNYALLIFWLLRISIREECSILKCLLAASVFAIIMLQFYSYLVFRLYGTFSISQQAPRHLLAVCLGSRVYTTYPDNNLVKQITEIFTDNHYSISYKVTTPVMSIIAGETQNPSDINIAVQEFVKQCILSNPIGYMKYIIYTIADNITVPFTGYDIPAYENNFFHMLCSIQNLLFVYFKIGHLYIISFLDLLATVFLWKKKSEFNWIYFGLGSFLFMEIIFVFLGTYAEFGRSLIHMLPFGVVSLVMLINDLSKGSFTYRRKKESIRGGEEYV